MEGGTKAVQDGDVGLDFRKDELRRCWRLQQTAEGVTIQNHRDRWCMLLKFILVLMIISVAQP